MARFAYSTNAYTKFSLTEAILDIGQLGFEGVEILADVPHAFPGTIDPAEISDALRRSGLSISNVNANTSLGLDREGRDPDGFWPGFLDPDLAVRRMRIDYVKGAIDLARAVGAKNVCTASGRLPDGVSPDIAAKHLDEAMAELLDYAERGPSVRIGIESEPGFFIGDGRAAKRLLEKHSELGVNLDIGHVVCVGEDPAEAVKTFAGRIWNLHVEDILGGVHDHLIPGEGDIGFEELRDALESVGYDGFLTLELYPYKDRPAEAGKKGLEYLRPIFRVE